MKERLRAYRDAGVTALRVQPEGPDAQTRVDNLGQVIDLVREISNES